MVKWTDKAKKILKKYFNFTELKDKQITIINELLIGTQDIIALLPTSFGKSMCFIMPSLLTKKTIFIISPLISLMDDQTENLKKKGITCCCCLHSNNSNKQQEIQEIIAGKIKIVYMSPEYLCDGDGFKLAIKLNEVNQLGWLAIDEAHCSTSWGHDFRPSYLKLVKFREAFPSIPILALTATAKPEVVNEIAANLKLRSPIIVRANFDRTNLFLKCLETPKQLTKKKTQKNYPNITYDKIIREYVEKYPEERIIVYVNTRKEVEEISEDLNKWKDCSHAYHAGLNKNIREEIQNDFSDLTTNVIISTIAFGMGIDQIVRCVLIFGAPSSIEEYYQQIGRGGRDGLQCETVLYFDQNTFNKKYFQVKTDKKKVFNLYKIKELFELQICRRHIILQYFGTSENYFTDVGFTCSNCDNCCKKDLVDLTEHFYGYYIKKKNISKNIKEFINIFNIDKLLKDWTEYIIYKKYKLEDIPDNLKIRLPVKLFSENKESKETKKTETSEDKFLLYESQMKLL